MGMGARPGGGQSGETGEGGGGEKARPKKKKKAKPRVGPETNTFEAGFKRPFRLGWVGKE